MTRESIHIGPDIIPIGVMVISVKDISGFHGRKEKIGKVTKKRKVTGDVPYTHTYEYCIKWFREDKTQWHNRNDFVLSFDDLEILNDFEDKIKDRQNEKPI